MFFAAGAQRTKRSAQIGDKTVQSSIDHRHSCIYMNIDELVEMLDTKLNVLSCWILDAIWQLSLDSFPMIG